jgi:chemotaxis signal transduction protein
LSNDDPEHSLLGTEVDPALREAALALPDSQRYAVSGFAPSPLSGGVPTYIYLASVRQGGAAVGGIAIVFNAEREFRAMLDDVLAGRDGLAAFVDGDGRVMAATDGLATGAMLPLDAGLGVVEHAGSTYASARVAGSGYREFKRSDGYQNHVRAVVALRLGSPERRRESLFDRPVHALPAPPRARRQEWALFQIGGGRFGLPAECVLEARPRDGLVRAPLGLAHAAGLLEVPAPGAGPGGSVVIPVLCGRSLFGVNSRPRDTDGVVLVLADPARPGRPLLGLRVDDVLSVVDADASHLQDAPAGLRQHSPLLVGLLRLGLDDVDSEVLAQMLDAEALCAMVCARPAVAEPVTVDAKQSQPA